MRRGTAIALLLGVLPWWAWLTLATFGPVVHPPIR
jgi:hypothetical protein